MKSLRGIVQYRLPSSKSRARKYLPLFLLCSRRHSRHKVERARMEGINLTTQLRSSESQAYLSKTHTPRTVATQPYERTADQPESCPPRHRNLDPMKSRLRVLRYRSFERIDWPLSRGISSGSRSSRRKKATPTDRRWLRKRPSCTTWCCCCCYRCC